MHHILLVDDDAAFRSEMRDLLEGYTVKEAADGGAALHILRQPHQIELVLLDQRMPDLEGTTVLGMIKDMAPDLPVILLTGYGNKDTVVKALRGRADEYLEKPLDPAHALQVIEQLLLQNLKHKDPTYGGTRGKIEKVKIFIERNAAKKVSLEEAAATVFVSPKYLSKIFKQETGMTFNHYRLEAKINKAKQMLANPGQSVEQISFALAYLNAESFIRMFKKITGTTPSAWRARNLKKQDER